MDDIEKLKRTLGPALGEARRHAGLTPEEMSTRLGLLPEVYEQLERGEVLLSVPTLHRLCVLFHLSAGQLLGLGPEETTPLPVPPPVPEEQDTPAEVLQLALMLRELPAGDVRSLVAIARSMARESGADGPPDESPDEPPEE